MKAENFNKDWKFWEDRDSFALVWSVPENAKSVDLPHDAMMERLPHEDSANGTNTGFYDGGNYVYEKKLFVSEEQRNEHLVLAFGGVYMNALVYVNEQEAGRELNGYTAVRQRTAAGIRVRASIGMYTFFPPARPISRPGASGPLPKPSTATGPRSAWKRILLMQSPSVVLSFF